MNPSRGALGFLLITLLQRRVALSPLSKTPSSAALLSIARAPTFPSRARSFGFITGFSALKRRARARPSLILLRRVQSFSRFQRAVGGGAPLSRKKDWRPGEFGLLDFAAAPCGRARAIAIKLIFIRDLPATRASRSNGDFKDERGNTLPFLRTTYLARVSRVIGCAEVYACVARARAH